MSTQLGPLFSPGQIVATPGALELLGRTQVNTGTNAGKLAVELIKRHLSGDWGQLCPEDNQQNVLSLEHGTRIVSSYPIGTEKLWIITEADRSVTTLLLPEEY